MKKVLITSYDLEIGGVERSLISMLNNFDYENYQVDLLLYSHTGDFMYLIPDNVNLLSENKSYKFCRQSIKELILSGRIGLSGGRIAANLISKIIEKNNNITESGYLQMQLIWKYCISFLPCVDKEYDIAISYLWPHDLVAKKVKAKKKIAWIHTDYSKLWIEERMDVPIWEQFENIVSISEDVSNAFLLKYPSLKNKIILIENITSPEFIKKLSNELINDFNFKSDDFNILSVGRLCHAKGYDNAIKALRRLHDRELTNIKWHVVGYGSDEEMLRGLIKEYGLEDSFILHGKKINPYPYIKACDLYIQPSRYEGKAVTVSEAKILGKAVLITNYTTAHSQLEHGLDGYITELSIDGIVEGVLLLYSDDILRMKLARKAQEIDYQNKTELNKLYKLL